MNEPEPPGPFPPIENKTLRLVISAMCTDRVGELTGWTRDSHGRYKNRDSLEHLAAIFDLYLDGNLQEEPARALNKVDEALGALVEYLLRRKPPARSLLRHTNEMSLRRLLTAFEKR